MQIILVGIYLLFYFLLGGCYLGVEWMITKINPKAQQKSTLRQYRFVQWGFRCVNFLSGVKIHVQGTENIPTDEPVLYIGNHRGIFDIVTSCVYCPGVTGYISKISMAKVPFLRVYMKRITCLFMDRDDIKQSLKIILQAIEQVKGGTSVFIYPEGTRNKNIEDSTDVAEFKEGSFKIAQKTGCKIVPVAVTGTAEIFENSLPLIHGGHVYLTFGKAIDMKELDKDTQKRIGEHCRDIVKGMLVEQKAMIQK